MTTQTQTTIALVIMALAIGVFWALAVQEVVHG